jgi:hypothetical protein
MLATYDIATGKYSTTPVYLYLENEFKLVNFTSTKLNSMKISSRAEYLGSTDGLAGSMLINLYTPLAPFEEL